MKKYVAYSSEAAEFQHFDTIDEAKEWLLGMTEECIMDEFKGGENWIAEVKLKTCVEDLKMKEDYSKEEWEEMCPDEDWQWMGTPSFKSLQ